MDQIEETLYDEVKCIITFVSYKALRVEFANGRFQWIPQSIIENLDTLELYNTEDPQILKVEHWFCVRYEINGWF